jgi:PAS domain S-box-containing protein
VRALVQGIGIDAGWRMGTSKGKRRTAKPRRRSRAAVPSDREHLLELALRICKAGYFSLDADTEEVAWSPESYRIWGRKPGSKVTSEWFLATVHPDDRRIIRERDADRKWTESTVDFRIVRGDGEPRHIQSRVIRERDKTDRVVRTYGVHIDVTEAKRVESELEHSEAKFETLFETSGAGISMASRDGTIRYANTAFAHLLGCTPQELLGQNLKDFSPPGEADPLIQLVPELLDGRRSSVTLEKRYQRRDGGFTWVRLSVNKVASSGADGISFVGVAQDITDRMHAVGELSKREAALRLAIATAEGANRAKTKFLANMSHELRTPLNAILGFAQLLGLKTKGSLNADQEVYVDSIVKGGEHLLRLINDVLDLARIDTGKLALHIEPVAVRGIVGHVIDNFRQAAARKNVELKVATSLKGDIHAAADAMRLTQVLMNLTSNAVKYNRPGGDVGFAAEVTPRQTVRISIRDTGRGIPRERQSEVFESFNRLGAELSGEEGTGIGLSLSKRLVEEMYGNIGFDSELGAGSTFWVELPQASASPRATVIPPHEARRITG